MSTAPRYNIYKITHRVSGKAYIGITTATVKYRWESHIRSTRRKSGSRTAITNAIAKYGPEAFDVLHIASALSLEDMKAVERLLIVQEGTKGPRGYNMTDGGDGTNNPTEEVRRKLSQAATGVIQSTETLIRKSASLKKAWETKERKTKDEYEDILRRAWVQRRLNGNDTHAVSAETREKIAASKRGKTFPPSFGQKVSDGLKRYIEINGSVWCGRKHTDETRARLRAAWVRRKARGQQQPSMELY